jgi:hypothetical protein
LSTTTFTNGGFANRKWGRGICKAALREPLLLRFELANEEKPNAPIRDSDVLPKKDALLPWWLLRRSPNCGRAFALGWAFSSPPPPLSLLWARRKA